MRDLSQLTQREIAIVKNPNVLNLGDAYPQIVLPNWLESILLDTNTNYYSIAEGLKPKTFTVFDLQRDVLKAACRCLGINETLSEDAFVTFSDSMSLFHAIVSQLKSGDSVITTNPSIDIVTGMIRKYTRAELIHVPAEKKSFHINTDWIASAIKKSTSTIIITSPENPTGAVCTEQQINHLVSLAIENDITLIFDQCFAKLNPQKTDIPLLPNYAPPNLKWICTWGTGKYFGLSGDKLGFIFCSPHTKSEVRKSLSLLQFEISRRMMLVFKSILEAAVTENYFDYLSSIIFNNASLVRESLQNTLIQSLNFDAGSVILLDISRLGVEDEEFTDNLLAKKSLGIIPVKYFFYSDPQGNELETSNMFARIALARNTDYLKTGLSRLVEYCLECQDNK